MLTLITNGVIINPDGKSNTNILINKEKIQALGVQPNPNLHYNIIDATNKYVIPGGIDVHTHLDMPFCETTSSDNFETGTIAAAFGGTTTIIDFAIQDFNKSLQSAYEIWRKKAEKKSAIDYGFHCIIREFNHKIKDQMLSLVNDGITSFKLFTAYPKVFMMNDGDIFQIMQHAKTLGASICVHAENGYIIDVLTKQALSKGYLDPKYHELTRPAKVEAESVHRVISLANLVDIPVYIVHLSSAEALDEIKYAKSQNKQVFSETCPQYLFLSRDNYNENGFNSAKYVMSPPLRSKNRQEDLWKGLKNNDIQVIATDHCPFFFKKQKTMGINNFTKIPNGIPSIETRVSLMFDGGVLKRKFSLERWVEILSTTPAKLFGLYPKKGVIYPGSDADIVIFDPNEEQILNVNNLHMNTDYSPYEGKKIKGTVQTVLSRGKIIISNKKFIGTKNHGNFIKREAGGMQTYIKT